MTDAYATAMDLLLAERPTLDDVQHATALLETAAGQGHSEASERLSLIEALGSARPPNWDRALDTLALAAAQGSSLAREQILLLANNAVDPKIPADADGKFWNSLRESIPLEQRMRPGDKQGLSDSPRIRLIRGFATPAECRWLTGLAREQLAPATVFDKESGGQVTNSARDNSFFVLRLAEMNLVTEVIRHRISAATNLPVPLFEPSQILHYSVGQQFKPHHDFLDPSNTAYHDDLARFGQRIATFLLYLNEGYEGGETSFPKIGLSFRAQRGDALFFANVTRDGAPDFQTLHAGISPTSGEKWVLSQWIRDRFPGA